MLVGSVLVDPESVKAEWKEYFEKLLNPKVAPNMNDTTGATVDPPVSPNVDPIELNEEITIEKVKTAIYANSDNKSPAIDGIRPPFIKNAS